MKSSYVCTQCGFVTAKWLGKCPGCNEWNTLEEKIEKPVLHKLEKPFVSTIEPKKLSEIKSDKRERFSTGIKELDNVLGGGIVPSSLVLLGGDPGIGKSTILTQVAGNVSKTANVLYVSAEESAYQMKMRADRLGIDSENFFLESENNLEEICAQIESNKYRLVVVDSIQAVYLPALSQSTGSVSQIRECASALMRSCKQSQTSVFIVGHVTKEGTIAGPKVLEHIMDTVLYFEGESMSFKMIRSVKNRFGSSNEVGIFDMTENGLICIENPSQILLSENRGLNAGAVATPYISGNRCLLVEVQSLVSKTVFPMPRRIFNGGDYNKLILLLAVLEKRGYIPLYDQDVYVNIMGGIKINEPNLDLAVIASVASSAKNTAISKDTAIIGEVGLTGEIRAVSGIEKCINECVKLGFSKIILPKGNQKNAEKYASKIELKYFGHIYSMIKELFLQNS